MKQTALVLAALASLIYMGEASARQGVLPSTMSFGQTQTDLASWDQFDAIRAGVPMNQPNNEFLGVLQGVAPPTNSPASTEKAGLLIQLWNSDPSDYVSGITRDLVGVDGRSIIPSGNMTGRAWGGYFWAQTLPGSDGYLQSLDSDTKNFGTDQPNLDTPTSKYGLKMESTGNTPITAFATMDNSGSTAHYGIVANRAAFVDPNEGPVIAARDNTNGIGNILGKMTIDGTFEGRHTIPLYNTNGLNPKMLPAVKPGEIFLWGDTSTGKSYWTFYDGVGYSLTETSKYMKAAN